MKLYDIICWHFTSIKFFINCNVFCHFSRSWLLKRRWPLTQCMCFPRKTPSMLTQESAGHVWRTPPDPPAPSGSAWWPVEDRLVSVDCRLVFCLQIEPSWVIFGFIMSLAQNLMQVCLLHLGSKEKCHRPEDCFHFAVYPAGSTHHHCIPCVGICVW